MTRRDGGVEIGTPGRAGQEWWGTNPNAIVGRKSAVILRPSTSRFTAGVERANELWVRDAVSCRSGFTPDMLVSGINPDLQQTEFIGSAAKNPVGRALHSPRVEPADGCFAALPMNSRLPVVGACLQAMLDGRGWP